MGVEETDILSKLENSNNSRNSPPRLKTKMEIRREERELWDLKRAAESEEGR